MAFSSNVAPTRVVKATATKAWRCPRCLTAGIKAHWAKCPACSERRPA